MLRKLWLALVLLLLASPGSAQDSGFDGLKFLGAGQPLVDKQSDSTLTLYGFMGKYQEKLVGVYLTQHGQQVRFYMNATTWDTLKQNLVKTRDQWEKISATQFAATGTVKGYRVGTALSTMRISIEGENDLDKKRLAFSLTGGGNTPKRVYASITFDQVKTLVEQFHKVDALLRGSATPN